MGPDTTFIALQKGGGVVTIEDTVVDDLRRIWKTEGQPQVPQSALDLIAEKAGRFNFKDRRGLFQRALSQTVPAEEK